MERHTFPWLNVKSRYGREEQTGWCVQLNRTMITIADSLNKRKYIVDLKSTLATKNNYFVYGSI